MYLAEIIFRTNPDILHFNFSFLIFKKAYTIISDSVFDQFTTAKVSQDE